MLQRAYQGQATHPETPHKPAVQLVQASPQGILKVQDIKPDNVITPVVTYFVRSDGSVRRVRAVRCAPGAATSPASSTAHAARASPLQARSCPGTPPACIDSPGPNRTAPRSSPGLAGAHSSGWDSAQRDPLAELHPCDPHQHRGAPGDGGCAALIDEVATDADREELGRLRRLGWQVEDADEASDQSVSAICEFSVACGCGREDAAVAERQLDALVAKHVKYKRSRDGRRLNAGTTLIISGLARSLHSVRRCPSAAGAAVSTSCRPGSGRASRHDELPTREFIFRVSQCSLRLLSR